MNKYSASLMILGLIAISIGNFFIFDSIASVIGKLFIPTGIVVTILGLVLAKKLKKLEKFFNPKIGIILASKTYSTIHYRKLAKIINCRSKSLLKTISKMVESGELEATIELPTIIFKN